MTSTTTTSTSFGSEVTETLSSSMNTEELSDMDLVDALQRGVLVMPTELALSAQLGYYDKFNTLKYATFF